MEFFHAVEGIITIIIIIGIGYALSMKGWLDGAASRFIPQVVTYVSLPAMMLWNLTSTFDREQLLSLLYGLVVPFASMFLALALGLISARVFRISPRRRGVFVTVFFCSNTIFIGVPVNLALFGESSLPYVLLYFFANTCFFWTAGNYLISRDGAASDVRFLSQDTLRHVFSPPFLGFLFAVSLVLSGIRLPLFVMDTSKYLAQMTTPLSLLFIGFVMYGVDLRKIRPDRDLLIVMLGRFVISPLAVLLAVSFFPVPKLMREVFLIQSALPAMTQVTIIAKLHGADAEYAALLTAITTLAAAILIPVYKVLL
jgi:predicted permease